MTADRYRAPRGRTSRHRRPAGHFLDLNQIRHILDTAWDLARDGNDRRIWEAALKVEVSIFTGLRSSELHNLHPEDITPSGGVYVRMGKGSKPRWTTFANGAGQSPTLAVLRRFLDGERRPKGRPAAPGRPIWGSKSSAWKKWVTNRLGPASGLQRRIPCMNGSTVPRYLIHPHLFRSCFVVYCRTFPPTYGQKPLDWPEITYFGGWESVDTVMRHYWACDLPNAMLALNERLPPSITAQPTHEPIPWNPRTWGQ